MSQPDLYTHDEPGAPTLNSTLGSLCEVLDTVLVNGFNVRACSITVASGVATVVASSHGYQPHRVIGIQGAAVSALNGRKVVTIVDSNTFTFDATGVPDGAVGGSTTCRRPGLGWAIKFSATNRRIYERPGAATTTMLLYVDENGRSNTSNNAVVRGLETATSIDAHGKAFPSTDRYAFCGAWSSTARVWSVVGDDSVFYMHTADYTRAEYGSYGGPRGMWMFGDMRPALSYDTHHCIVSAHVAPGAIGYGPSITNSVTITSSSGTHSNLSTNVCRAHSQIGDSVGAHVVTPYAAINDSGVPSLPLPADFNTSDIAISAPGSAVVRTLVSDVPSVIRGRLPGLATVLTSTVSSTGANLFDGETATLMTPNGALVLIRMHYTAVVAYSLSPYGWE